MLTNRELKKVKLLSMWLPMSFMIRRMIFWIRSQDTSVLFLIFQSYDQVKLYCDDGQPAVAHALQAAFEYALSKQAFIHRNSSYHMFRLAQVADYLCAIELTAAKFEHHCETSTDLKFFGGVGSFKKNWLKQARRKLLV